MALELTNEEISRYSRHLLLPEIGVEGQVKLKNAKVLIVGTGVCALLLRFTCLRLVLEQSVLLILTK